MSAAERGSLPGWLATGAALCAVLLASRAAASSLDIPATPVMTLYQFNGPREVPTYDASRFGPGGPGAPAGTLALGSSVVPCLVLRDGKPLTDVEGTPYVGFEVVVDAARATPESTARFNEVATRRKELRVADHHCPPGTKRVIEVRRLFALPSAPRFDPPRPAAPSAVAAPAGSELDAIVRAFHGSPQCDAANRRLMGRRDALKRAWTEFAAENAGRWSARSLSRARHLDFVMRTAIYEGHLERGCGAYGACERNVIALSIRNRGQQCQRGQGCGSPGDYEGVASAVSQYNIWDENLTQTSGLTGCFLRPDLAGNERYVRLQAMYEQSVPDVEKILFGHERAVSSVFSGRPPAELARLRHYYHPPAMGKCFPSHPRLEYISGAVASRDGRFALIADTRIEVGAKRGSGYLFRQAFLEAQPRRDVIRVEDRYPGFVIDGRKVQLQPPSRCAPYGTPRGCRFDEIGRYRKIPSWLEAGEPLALTCRIASRGPDCRAEAALETVRVGGVCDVDMQPTAGVP